MKNFLAIFRKKKKFDQEKFLAILSEGLYLLGLFIIPLYFSVIFPTYNIFELGKLFVFKILVLILLFITLWRVFFSKLTINFSSLTKFRHLIIYPLIFIIGLGISLFFSDNFIQSFFGSYDRQAGYLSYLYYFTFFILLVINLLKSTNLSNFSGEKKIHRLLLTLVLSGFFVSLYGILQSLGIDFLIWPEDPLITKRAFSSLGQANFLASWLLLVIPLSFYLIWKTKNNLGRFFYSLIALAQIISLSLTASRGGVIALGLAVLLGGVYLFKKIKITTTKKIKGVLIVLFVFVSGFLFLNSFFPGRLASLTDFERGSLAARLDFYQAAFEAWQKKPLFGYGLENSTPIFLAAYEPDWGIHSNIGVVNDRAHNLLLDLALNGGLFLLLIFGSFYYFISRLFVVSLKTAIRKGNRNLAVLVFSLGFAILAYLLSLLFNFSFSAGEIYFFTLVAILTVIYFSSINLEEKVKPYQSSWLMIGLLVIVGFFISQAVIYEIKALRADNYFFSAAWNLKTKNYQRGFDLFVKAEELSPNPINRNYYQRFVGNILSEVYLSAENPSELEPSWPLFVPEKLVLIANQLSGQEFTDLFLRAKIKAALNQKDEARNLWQTAAELAPYWPQTYLELARSFRQDNLFKEALVYNNLALQILPSPDDSRFNEEHLKVLQLHRQIIFQELGTIYFSQGDYQTAENYYQKAYQANPNNLKLLKRLADTYYVRQNYSQALHYILHGAKRSPQDYIWFLGAALLLEEQGEDKQASQYFQQVQELAPDKQQFLELQN